MRTQSGPGTGRQLSSLTGATNEGARPRLSPHAYQGKSREWTILNKRSQRELVRMAQAKPAPDSIFRTFPRKAANELLKRFDLWLKRRVRHALVGFGGLQRGQQARGWFRPQHMPDPDDLLQIARDALLGAIKRYKPKSRNGLNSFARRAVDGALHDAIKAWRLKGRTYGTAGDEKESRADRWLYDNPRVKEHGVWRPTTIEDIVKATCKSHDPKAIARACKSAEQALLSREDYRDGDISYDTTEPCFSDPENDEPIAPTARLLDLDDAALDLAEDSAISQLFAADEWRSNCDCFSKHLAPHLIFHEAIVTAAQRRLPGGGAGARHSSAFDARAAEIDLREMRRLAQIGAREYANELVWRDRRADRRAATGYTVPPHHDQFVYEFAEYTTSVNTAATAAKPIETPPLSMRATTAEPARWPLVWSEKDRRGRWHLEGRIEPDQSKGFHARGWQIRGDGRTLVRTILREEFTDNNATRRMADLVIAIDNDGDSNAKPERHDALRVGGDLYQPDRSDSVDIRQGRRAAR